MGLFSRSIDACMVCDQFLRRNHSMYTSLALTSEGVEASATSSSPATSFFRFRLSVTCFQMSPAATTCSKTPTTTPETQKTPATNICRPIPMKIQTDSDRFRPMTTDLGCPCYCYFEKTLAKWVDLWICLYLCHLCYFFYRKNLEKWLDPWILTSLLIVGVLYALDELLRIQTRPFKLVLLLRKLSEMVKIMIGKMVCKCVARYCDCIGICCLFGTHVIAENILVSPVIRHYEYQCI